jgi:hypothetical protein
MPTISYRRSARYSTSMHRSVLATQHDYVQSLLGEQAKAA